MKEDSSVGNEPDATTVEQLMNELTAVKKELQSVKQEFHNYRNAVSKKFEGHEKELEELEARFEGDNPEGQTDDDGDAQDDLLPIERISRLKQDDPDHPAIPSNGRESLDRAMSIFNHFEAWSEKTPKGNVLKSGIKRLLETATGETLEWTQAYRSMDMLEEWSNGVISHEQHHRFGHILVMDESRSLLSATG